MNDSVKPEQLSVADRLATLPPEVQQLFANAKHGTPDNISKAGCLALARLGKDAWNAWREAFPVKGKFDGPPNWASFAGCDFTESCLDFSGFSFGDNADFSNAKFGSEACFEGSHFGNAAKFIGTDWPGFSFFSGCLMGWGVDFSRSCWHRRVDFSGLMLGADASFEGAHFMNDVIFSQASTVATGADCKFMEISFAKCRFTGKADFANRQFTARTNFAGARFAQAPIFHGSELYQNTIFDGAEFPPAGGHEEAARSYRTLKLHFINQQNVREEQRFFRLEMAEEAKQAGRSRWLYWLYGQSSDYGFSLWRPVVLFVLVVLVFAQVYGLYDNSMQSCWPGEAACEIQREWLNFSLAQSMPLPGFDNLKRFEENFSETVPICFVAINKVLAFILFFLAGLALRNLFRLK